MTEAPQISAGPEVQSPAHLRHEHRTPVNHIIGYSELLIEDADARNLGPFVGVFQQIHDGGLELLELIQSAFGEYAGPLGDLDYAAFRTSIRMTAAEMAETVKSLAEDMDRGHRQTLADLEAISWAIRRLLELAGQDVASVEAKQAKPARRSTDFGRDETLVPVRRSGGKILIADDDAANRNLLRRRLECEGHEVVEARDGLEVLDALKVSPCDLVLLDILMPVMDGFQALAKIKQDPRLCELPVIMISALDELQNVVRCIEMGAEDYLSKPFNRVLLRARIGASLEKKWLRDRERRKTEELEQTLGLLEQAQRQLAVLASRDTLTGLANRRFIETHLDFLVKRGVPFMAIYIDLNGFKKINDTYGHAAGDDLLKQVGSKLRTAFRSTDVIGRWGGDEFVALGDVSADVQLNVSRIKEVLTADFVVTRGDEQQLVQIGAAVGVATWRPGDTATEVLRRADFEMYEEKLRGTR